MPTEEPQLPLFDSHASNDEPLDLDQLILESDALDERLADTQARLRKMSDTLFAYAWGSLIPPVSEESTEQEVEVPTNQ